MKLFLSLLVACCGSLVLLSGSPAATLSAERATVEAFVDRYEGSMVADPNGYLPGECVSLVKRYHSEVQNGANFIIGGNGGAYRMWVDFESQSALTSTYVRVSAGATAERGDIAIWDANTLLSGNPYGHAGVVWADAGPSQVRVFDQYNPSSPAGLRTYTKSGLLGFLRPIDGPSAVSASVGSRQIAIGPDNNPRIVAIKKSGTMFTRYAQNGKWSGFKQHGSDGSWASASLAIGPNKVVRLIALKKDGTLYTRSAGNGKWSGFTQHGADGSWASASLAIGPDNNPRIVAIKKSGTMFTRYAQNGKWSGFKQHGSENSWCTTC
jgi:hypothetical protein